MQSSGFSVARFLEMVQLETREADAETSSVAITHCRSCSCCAVSSLHHPCSRGPVASVLWTPRAREKILSCHVWRLSHGWQLSDLSLAITAQKHSKTYRCLG
eukprot:5631499-Amphidinium_carterae.1